MSEKPSKPDLPLKQTGDVTEKPSKPDLPRNETDDLSSSTVSRLSCVHSDEDEPHTKEESPIPSADTTGDMSERPSKPDLPRNGTDDLSSSTVSRLSCVHSDEDEPHTKEESPIPSADTTGDMSERPSKPDLPRNGTDDLSSSTVSRLSSVHSDEDEPHTKEESPIPSANTAGDMSEKPSKPDLPRKQTGDVTEKPIPSADTTGDMSEKPSKPDLPREQTGDVAEKPTKPDLPHEQTDDLSSSTVSRLSSVHSDEDEPHTMEESPIPSADTAGDVTERPSKPDLPHEQTDDLSSSTVSRLSSVHSDEDEPHTKEESPIPSADTAGDVTEKPTKPDLPHEQTDDLSSSTVSRLSSVHSDEDGPHTKEESPIPSADTAGDVTEKPSKPDLPREQTDDLSSSTVSSLSSLHLDEDEPHTKEESSIPSADTAGDVAEKPSKPDLPLKQTDDLSSRRLSSVHSDEDEPHTKEESPIPPADTS
ncbi:MAG: uncharacterized protein KVP18_000277, partial [Porospora cf. gigantea A]